MSTEPGWAAIPNDVARDPRLHYAAKAVFIALASHANKAGQAWPSQATICAEVGMAEATVKRQLLALRDYGLITWEVRATERGRQRFYQVWRPGGVGSSQRGVGSSETGGVWSPQGGEQEPVEPEPLEPVPSATASGEFALLSEDDVAAPAEEVSSAEALFAEWYALYPAKKDKGAARKAHAKAFRKVGQERLMTALRRQLPALTEAHQRGYCKYPATWLNSECWDDEVEAPGATVHALRPEYLNDPEYAAAVSAALPPPNLSGTWA